MRRRRFLASVSAVAAGLYAGCVGDGDAPSGTDPSPDDRTDTETPTPTPPPTRTPTGTQTPTDRDVQPSVRSHSIETVETACLSGEGTGVAVTFGEDTVEIEGTARTATPCYRAGIDSADVNDGELRVQVGFERTDDVCVECVGAVTYAATVSLDGIDGLEAVTVTHGPDGDQFTERRPDDSPGSPSPDSSTTPSDEYEPAPDPDLQVSLDNEHDESHKIGVEIQRESGETVYAETHRIDAGSERDIYNLREASPDGIETFTVTATMDGTTESMQVETSDCYGAAIVSVTADGTLYPYYAIC